jgi:DnaJ-class molecular chaperone
MGEVEHYEMCHACFGKGYIDGEAYAECPYCDGTGWIDISEEFNYDEEDEDDISYD